jgi:parvulin-like peptidyl-prolyl isomerase
VAGARYEPDARFYLADLDPDLKTRLLATNPGEVCGPFPSGEEYWLLQVGERTPPSLEDPELRARVTGDLVERAVDQAVLRSVRWHEAAGS